MNGESCRSPKKTPGMFGKDIFGTEMIESYYAKQFAREAARGVEPFASALRKILII